MKRRNIISNFYLENINRECVTKVLLKTNLPLDIIRYGILPFVIFYRSTYILDHHGERVLLHYDKYSCRWQ